jgi:flavin-dependent dehydrogenase
MDLLIAFWAHVPVTIEERLLFVESTDCGWWYFCPNDASGMIACFVTDAPAAQALGTSHVSIWNELFKSTRFCQELHCRVSATCIHVARTGMATLLRKHGARWIVAGDSAGKLDPIGSSGTSTAIDSGLRGAQAVIDLLMGNNETAERYGLWFTSLINEFTRQRTQHYEIAEARRVGGFWTRRLRQSP